MSGGVLRVLVYGANGYTAGLILPSLRALPVELVLAGRNPKRIALMADQLDCESRTFDLLSPARLDSQLRDIDLVLNAAGPFTHTAPALIDACLRQRVDYLDLCGELGPLQYAQRCGPIARALDVMLLPSVGFDVVVSDCLARYLAGRNSQANKLRLSISASNLLSHGSAVTLAEHAGTWVHVRRSGRLEAMRFRTQVRWVDFGDGPCPTIAVSWGDLVTAHHSTAIPNIEVYFEATAFRWSAVTLNQYLGWMFRDAASRTWLRKYAELIPGGPNERLRQSARSVIVGEVEGGGRRVCARVTTPECYTTTRVTTTAVLERIISGGRRSGFTTPSELFGEMFGLELPGVRLEDL